MCRCERPLLIGVRSCSHITSDDGDHVSPFFPSWIPGSPFARDPVLLSRTDEFLYITLLLRLTLVRCFETNSLSARHQHHFECDHFVHRAPHTVLKLV